MGAGRVRPLGMQLGKSNQVKNTGTVFNPVILLLGLCNQHETYIWKNFMHEDIFGSGNNLNIH